MARLTTELDHQEIKKTPAGEDQVANRMQNTILGCVARNVQRNRMEFEFQSSLSFVFRDADIYASSVCMHECACTLVRVCTWGSQGAHAFSCLFVFERREPSQVTGVKPQLSDSLVNGGGLASGLSGGGVKKTERVNDGGRERGRPMQDNSPDVGSFTDTGNAWPHTLRNVHSGPLVLKV